MKEYLLGVPSQIMRWFDGGVVVLSGISSLIGYYLVKFDICAGTNCSNLKVTKFLVSLPELYLVFGASTIISGVFLMRNRTVARVYRLGIEVALLVGALLLGMLVFGINIEIKSTA